MLSFWENDNWLKMVGKQPSVPSANTSPSESVNTASGNGFEVTSALGGLKSFYCLYLPEEMVCL